MKTAILLVAAAVGLATASELQVEVTHKVECERKTKNGDNVEMHYRGTLLATGAQFDASTYRQLFYFPRFNRCFLLDGQGLS